jgi:hypothetical protein
MESPSNSETSAIHCCVSILSALTFTPQVNCHGMSYRVWRKPRNQIHASKRSPSSFMDWQALGRRTCPRKILQVYGHGFLQATMLSREGEEIPLKDLD